MSMSVLLVGCGNMGGAMLGGWIEQNIKPNNIVVVDPSPDNLEKAQKLGCRSFSSPLLIEEGYVPDVIIFAVKPQVIGDVMESYKEFAREGALIISIAAGTKIQKFQEQLGQDAAIIRTMPNTPAAIRQGMMVSCGNEHVTEEHKKLCDILMEAIGETAWVEDEDDIDRVTGLSGSGPAYVFYMIESMIKAGVAAGLSEELSTLLAKTTVAGAGQLAIHSTEDVSKLRENVTSPGGTTAAGLQVLMAEDGLAPLMEKTVAAAIVRSKELG
ncbi:pyrroline-5-carboxylate reductase [Sneathiella sp. P13V-1]|uniref:pyrroline-5-carboxylate reductase n=1 Tax=Sneathiella sp. P13V-1 TaxID=2697366 RepID=UPI00187B282C|nr:pyrroline-5-carboxylate reductase [Sneathiella sp. P13V-1]MBE7638072.1 pyrroline-5-carboxylate reductase [Sneathiella sp. P13V-1]